MTVLGPGTIYNAVSGTFFRIGTNVMITASSRAAKGMVAAVEIIRQMISPRAPPLRSPAALRVPFFDSRLGSWRNLKTGLMEGELKARFVDEWGVSCTMKLVDACHNKDKH